MYNGETRPFSWAVVRIFKNQERKYGAQASAQYAGNVAAVFSLNALGQIRETPGLGFLPAQNGGSAPAGKKRYSHLHLDPSSPGDGALGFALADETHSALTAQPNPGA